MDCYNCQTREGVIRFAICIWSCNEAAGCGLHSRHCVDAFQIMLEQYQVFISTASGPLVSALCFSRSRWRIAGKLQREALASASAASLADLALRNCSRCNAAMVWLRSCSSSSAATLLGLRRRLAMVEVVTLDCGSFSKNGVSALRLSAIISLMWPPVWVASVRGAKRERERHL